MWELDHKEGWALKNWCVQTVVLEKSLESPLDCKEIKPVNPKGNQHWIFIRRTENAAEAPILWPPYGKTWLTGKNPDARKDWGQEEKGFQRMRWLVGVTDSIKMSSSKPRGWCSPGSLGCWSPWGLKESDTAEWLNNNTPSPVEGPSCPF